jgi:hypothetical protein
LLLILIVVSPWPLAPAAAASPTTIWFAEAEESDVRFPMVGAWDAGASACGYVSSAWHEEGGFTLSFDVPRTGDYWLWGRGMGLALYQNSFWVAVDGASPIKYELPQFDGAWTWDWEVVHPAHEPVAPYRLEAGQHRVTFGARESRARLDALWITDTAGATPPTIAPCGQTATPSPAPTASPTPSETPLLSPTPTATVTPQPTVQSAPVVWQCEAEHGQVTPPMVVRADALASGNQCVDAPVHEGGATVFTIGVERAGTYYLWARAMGQADTHNSFWVSLNGGTPIKYEIPQFGGAWAFGWEVVHPAHQPVVPYLLAAGQHTVQFAARESDARLDALLLTADAAYVPVGLLAGPQADPTATPTATPTHSTTPSPTFSPTASATAATPGPILSHVWLPMTIR